jgi:hypothetical protein
MKKKFEPHLSIERKHQLGFPLFSKPIQEPPPQKLELKVDINEIRKLNNPHNESSDSEPLDIIEQRVEDALKEKKSDGARLSYINSPINGIKQTAVQKKLNTMKYWELVDLKIKKENAPLFKNHTKLKLPPPKKSHKQEYKSDIPLWVQVCNQPVGKIYNLRHFNYQFWIKHYNDASKVFSLKENHQLSKKEYIKYCWDRKDARIFVS